MLCDVIGLLVSPVTQSHPLLRQNLVFFWFVFFCFFWRWIETQLLHIDIVAVTLLSKCIIICFGLHFCVFLKMKCCLLKRICLFLILLPSLHAFVQSENNTLLNLFTIEASGFTSFSIRVKSSAMHTLRHIYLGIPEGSVLIKQQPVCV